MDLTKIDKLFGELDDATKGALLLAAHRGEVIEFWSPGWYPVYEPMWDNDYRYRVQPKPVIGEVVRYGDIRAEAGLFNRWIGYPDPLTFTFPTRDGQHVPGVYTSPEGLQIKIEVAG